MPQRIMVPFDLEQSIQEGVSFVFEEDLDQCLEADWKRFSHMQYICGEYQSPVIYTLVK